VNVGDRAERRRTVTAGDIELFTALTGDRNPLHYDEAVAAATRFGGIVVQGGVTTGLLNAVVAEDLPGPGSVFLHTDSSYRAPVRPGDTITAEVEVLEQRQESPSASCRPRSSTSTATSSSTAPPSSGASHFLKSAPDPPGPSRPATCDGREQEGLAVTVAA